MVLVVSLTTVLVFVVKKAVYTMVALVTIIYMMVAVQNVVKVKSHQSPGEVCPPCPPRINVWTLGT